MTSMVVSGHGPAMHAENLLRAAGHALAALMGATVQKRTARGTSTLLARGTGVAARLRDFAFGTYFLAGVPESSRRRN